MSKPVYDIFILVSVIMSQGLICPPYKNVKDLFGYYFLFKIKLNREKIVKDQIEYSLLYI